MKNIIFLVIYGFLISKIQSNEKELNDLFDKMEIEDKCGQMTQITLVN